MISIGRIKVYAFTFAVRLMVFRTQGEDISAAATREVKEETGVSNNIYEVWNK
jgi:ADP-ribose pyrophosphatase YjhB (NUDIX family)